MIGTGNGHAGNGSAGWEEDPFVGRQTDNANNGHLNSGNDPDDDIGFLRATVQYQGRIYTHEVDGCWIDNNGAELSKTPLGYVIKSPPPLWQTSNLTKWAGKTIPPRRWFMEEWLPRGQCTGLYGIPGVRKSLWCLQAMIAGALGTAFCGIPIEPDPVLGLFCEDADEELARRAQHILHRYGANFTDLSNLCCSTLVGVQATEFVHFTRGGTMLTGPAYGTFREQLGDIKPQFACLDTASDFFGGNENTRPEVHAFIRLLDGLAQEFDTALMFSAHPSRRGIAQGSIDSGSTGWEGKVRARLVLHDPAENNEQDSDESPSVRRLAVARDPSDERVLTRAKSNYAKPGAEIELVLRDNVFWPKDIDPESASRRGPMRNLMVEAKFLELMGKVKAAGRWVHDTPTVPSRYAPKVFARHPDRGDVSEKEFKKAMDRMMGRRIRLVETSRAGRKYLVLEEI